LTIESWLPIVKPHISGTISFDAIEALRQKLCPEASQQSALIGVLKAWPQPCLLNARLAKKRGDARQGDLFGSKDSRDSLRAFHVTINEAARQAALVIYENMRVPETSIIHRVVHDAREGKAVENLSSWETSKGDRLSDRVVEIQARKSWDSVHALITPKGPAE
jgi:hypothetical protein